MTDEKHWFVPKSHGLGAYPANWKGWAAIAAFVVIVNVLALVILMPWQGMPLSMARLLLWLAATAAITLGFIKLAEVKTLGDWRWRWGDEK